MRSQATSSRSLCPINASLETFGDSWSLLILRDIMYFGKKTYGEFMASDEHIARSILANRLERLQEKGLLIKRPHTEDRRKDFYDVTDAGLDLLPILLDMADWGTLHDHDTAAPEDWLQLVRTQRAAVIACVRDVVRAGGSIFGGKNNAYEKLMAVHRNSKSYK